MSRVAKVPIGIPNSVQVSIEGQLIKIKSGVNELSLNVHPLVNVVFESGVISVSPAEESASANAQAGTARALINNMVVGVSQGFEKRLQLVGVGYKAAIQGNAVNLSLGFSHPVIYPLPAGIKAETPTHTEIILKGADKQVVGHVASEIRAYRPPEPYKGKGVRYAGEHVAIKETKKE